MDTTYRLTQTGKQVQDLLDQVDPNKEAIAAETTRAEAAEQTLQDNIDAEQAAREAADAALRSDLTAEAERAEIAEHTLQGNIDAEEQSRIADVDAEQARAEASEQANATAIAAEETRATAAEQTLQGNIDAEEQSRIADVDAEQARAEAAEQANAAAIAAEETRATAAEQTLQDNIDAEEDRAEAAEQQNASDISAINAKIPAEASAQNQLADKSFVNSSVATASATFRGSYNLILDLHLPIDATRQQIVGALNASIHEADNNDYCFVQIPTDPEHALLIQAVDRYKFNGSTWAFEYALNNSGFTQAQWAALNSGITSGLVAKLNGLPNNDALTQLLAGKQDNLTFDNTPTVGSQNPVTSAGIKEAIDAISGGSSAALDAEIARATAAEQAIQDDLNDELQTRQAEDIVLQQNIEAEETRARAAEQQNDTDIAAINAKIPVEASAQNQLADKNYVNTCVATDSATFRGSYNLVTDLHLTVAATRAQILAALTATIAVADNNDYAFVLIPTSDATPGTIARVERYKYNGTQWGFEYELNNSGFTQAQWDAINSGITSGLVAKLNDLPNEAALQALLQGLQDAIAAETTRATAAEQANATAIAAETTRATTAEETLQDNIDAEEQARIAADNALDAKIGDNTDAIAAETTRATAAEQANATAIAAETTRATTAEETLQDNIDAEETARIAADNALDSKIGDNTDAIAAETTRATAAEQANATAIAAETTRATAAEQALQDNIDAEETARIAADNALDAKIGDNTDAIAAETTRATAAEQANATAIAAETTRATTAEETLQDNIDAEETARIAADNALDSKIGDNTDAIAAETTRATAAEQANATAIAAETTRATAAEQALQDNIDAEETARIAADNALDAKIGDNTDAIAAETTRATAAEQANATAISDETTRATTAEETLQDNIDAEETARIAADNALDAKIGDNTDAIAAETIRATTAEETLQDNIDAEETARIAADNALDAKIGDNTDAIAAETTRATAAEQANATAIAAETTRATAAEQANATAIAAETTRATTAEETLQDNIDAEETARIAADEDLQDAIDTKQDALEFDSIPTAGSNNPVTSDGIRSAIDTAVGNEETRARAAEQVNALAIDDVEALIPNQATSQNQLADKAYVQNAIATNTGDFVGTFNNLAELEAVPNPHNNDYGYVISVDQQGNQSYDRYKYNGSTSAWEFEYSLNNSSFTAEEWAAIQSGITSALVKKLSDLYTKAQLDVILDSKQSALTFDNVPTPGSDNPVKSGGIYNSLAEKQDTISDLASIRSGAAAGATAYQKPSSGIPDTDLSQGVQDSLDAADSAYQKPATGIPASDLAQGVQDSLDAADSAYQKPSTGIPDTDLSQGVQDSLDAADSAYQKPSTGIPDTDLSQGVQDSLDAADTAYQKPSTGIPETDLDAALQQKINSTVDITGKADKVDNATSGDLAALDASGNLTDSGKKVSDFATAAQGALADTAYQKPSAGIPKTDLASGVQDSLDNADSAYQLPSTGIPENDLDATTQSKIDAGATAYQKPSGGIPSTDLASGVQTSLGKADAAAPQSTTYTKTEVDNLVGAEETRAEGVEQGLKGDIDAIEAKIPSAASSSNQLADKAFVNSSVATNTANYISNNGEPFTSLAQLEAYSGTLTNNDYAFVVGTDQAGNTTYTRYKYNATTQTWAKEYVLNNSSFTAEQWAAISSGITAALVGKLSDLPTNSELTTLLAGKQDVISDLATIRSGAASGATAYQKPSAGIPDTDLSQGVQTSLGKADTAYQKPSGGIPSTDLASAVNTSLGKADTAYQKPSGGIPYADLAANAKGLPVGSGTVTSLASLPVTNRVIIATISANQPSVSIANGVTGLPAGCDLHVIIHATADVTITLPTSSPYVNCNADSTLTVASGGYAELNFVSDGTSIYVRGIV